MEEAIRQPCWAACGESQSIWNGILFTRRVHPPPSSCCRALSDFLFPFSVLCKVAWRRSARCSWAPGVRQTCVSCTTSVPFYRWVSPSRWTSVSGICAINSRCGRQKLLQGPLVKEPLLLINRCCWETRQRRHTWKRYLLSWGLGFFGTWPSGSLGLWSGSRP